MRLVPLTVLAFLLSTAALAQVTDPYAEWAEGPVKFLMTVDEARQWKTLHSNAEAQAFIDLFWARRDPTPDTARNEFREEFDRRVALADKQFTGAAARGALSDPGRALILLGPPYNVSGRAGAAAAGALGPTVDVRGSAIVPGVTREPNQMIWMYAHDKKPKYIRQSDFTLIFLDEGNNDWKIAYTERVNPDQIFQEAVRGLIISPKLTKATFPSTITRVRPTSFKDPLLDAAYKKFRSDGKESVGPSSLTWGEFVTPGGDSFIAAQLYVSAGADIAAGQKVNFFTVIEDFAGLVVDINEDPATMTASGKDCYAEKSLQLDPGTYTATFGLAAPDGHILSATRTPLTVEKLDPTETAVSPLILSSSITPLKSEASALDPFSFGGLKVVPKGDLLFVPSGDLWYFVELRNPGEADGGMPKIQVKIDIKGQTAKGPAEMKLPMQEAKAARLQGEDHRFALGLALPLEGFIPGDYTMKIHVVDTVLGKNYDLEKHFRVRPAS